ncbi:MAG: N-acetyltransferase [Bacteroidaceae bacterium]|nr:N-acetyltransferase [Bacteroidaceae bacterium]
MCKIKVVKVENSRQMGAFVQLPKRLYSGSKFYVPDLDDDIRDMFNSQKNTALKYAEIQAFLAYRGDKVVGRIAGIINRNANERWGKSYVRFGLIEFEDDIAISDALLKAVEQWGAEHGMTQIQGPMGIIDFDKEGMLVEDFDLMGSMIDIYNPPYYPQHMVQLGYEKEADWLQVRVEIPKEVPAKYARVANLAKEMFGLKVRKISRKEILGEPGHQVFRLMNEAYAPIFGYSDLTEEMVTDLIKKYIPILDPDLITTVENEKGEMVCAAVTAGSLSNTLRKSNGKLLPFGWVHFLKTLFFKNEDTVNMMLIAVRPDMQGLGVNALVFDDLIPIYNRKGYKYAETGPQLEDNVKELTQWKPLNPKMQKRRRCWVKTIEKQ